MRQPNTYETRAGSGGIDDGQWVVLSLLALAVVVGIVARFQGLGFRPLAEDEYYFLVSVESLFRSGLPEQAGGGYYVRGLPLQYLTAVFRAIFQDPEFGLRLPTVLLSLITVPVAFFYGRRVGGPYLGAGLAIVLLVSSWEVEFSRFGRMYGAFQLLTLLFVFSLHSVLTDRASPRGRYLPLLWGSLAALTHQLGYFLLPLVALPAVLPGVRERFGSWAAVARYASVTMVVYVVLITYYVIPFRTLNLKDALPEGASELVAAGPGLFRVPSFPFWSVADSPLLNLALVLLAIVAIGFVVHGSTRGRLQERVPLTLASMALTAAVLHQITLALGLAGLTVGRYRIHRSSGHRPVGTILFLAGLVSVGWLALGGLSRVVPAVLPTFLLERLAEHRFSTTFLGWPVVYAPVIEPWTQEMPTLAALLAVGVLCRVWTILDRTWKKIALDPSSVVVYVVILMGILSSYFHSTRYTYFIYPLALACLYLSLDHGLRRLFGKLGSEGFQRHRAITTLLVFLGLFALSEDFDPGHLLRTGSTEVTFQTGRFEKMRETWYWRTDTDLPGRFVTSQALATEPVIVMDLPEASYYIRRPHAVYYPRTLRRFYDIGRNGGTVDFWSGGPLLSTPQELGAFLDGAARAWIVRKTDAPRPQVISEALGNRPRRLRRVFVGRDARVEVVRIEFEE